MNARVQKKTISRKGKDMKKLKRFLACLTVACCLICTSQTVNATENTAFEDVSGKKIILGKKDEVSLQSETVTSSLGGCELGVGIYENGIGIEFTTRATVEAEEIGVKNLILHEKTLFGWNDIPIKDYCDYDVRSFSKSLVYVKAEYGKTYKVTCTHYAIIDGIEYTLDNYTDEIVYN